MAKVQTHTLQTVQNNTFLRIMSDQEYMKSKVDRFNVFILVAFTTGACMKLYC